MAWRIVKQPNGLLAKFSDIVDTFTNLNMTEEEALACCRETCGEDAAKKKKEFYQEGRQEIGDMRGSNNED